MRSICLTLVLIYILILSIILDSVAQNELGDIKVEIVSIRLPVVEIEANIAPYEYPVYVVTEPRSRDGRYDEDKYFVHPKANPAENGLWIAHINLDDDNVTEYRIWAIISDGQVNVGPNPNFPRYLEISRGMTLRL